MAFYPEVLSPVGSKEALEAAVRSGADAVYLGAKNFSARRNADNFDKNELKSAISYCHIRNVKVYLTLNIMIKEHELRDAFNLAKEAYKSGIDGIIIADLGLAKILKDNIPKLNLHGSTQMTVHSVSALPYLKELGFTRVVAAREMSEKQLSDLCAAAKKLDMEIEVFVHGALCMCVSGQCLLSSVLGGRSGNRGLCAGPCRLPFKASNGTGYDLSLKDLSLVEHIDKLKNMGVASLKIEGRMKRPEYVAAATAYIKSAVKGENISQELEGSLNSVFSRSGFTDGYFTENLGKDMFGIRTKDDVLAADNKTFATIHNLYRNELQSVAINISAKIKRDNPITVELNDKEHNLIIVGDVPQIAQNRAVTKENIEKSLSKCGGTPYFVEDIEIDIDEGLFVSASTLNDMRRQLLEELTLKRQSSARECDAKWTPEECATSPRPITQKIIARFGDINNIPDTLDKVWGVAFPTDKPLPLILPTKELIAEIPRWIDNEEQLRKQLSLFKEKGFTYALCGNLASLKISNDLGLKVIGGAGLNICNSESLSYFSNLGADMLTLSAEIKMEDAKSLCSPIPKGILAYGRIPLMITKNCPLKNGRTCKECDKKGIITDRKNIDFPIECRGGKAVELLNSTPLFLADKKEDLNAFDFILLWFTDESKEEITEVIDAYINGGTAPKDFTRGLYYKNLL